MPIRYVPAAMGHLLECPVVPPFQCQNRVLQREDLDLWELLHHFITLQRSPRDGDPEVLQARWQSHPELL